MSPTLAYQLHASLMLSARKRSREYVQQARQDAWHLNQDQIDRLFDEAATERHNAWAHLQAAKRAKLIADFAGHGMAVGKYLSHAGIRYEVRS